MEMTVMDALLYYLGSWFWFILCLLSIVVIFLRQKPGSRKRIVLWALFSTILMYNGFSMRLICKIVEPLTYYRFFWLVPGSLLIAYALLLLMQWFRFKLFSVVLFIGFFLLLRQTGTSFRSLDSFQLPENEYELGADIFQLEELITANKEQDRPRIAMPSTVQMEYRTYDASVQTAIRKEVYQGMGRKDYTYTGNGKLRWAEYLMGGLLDAKRLYPASEVAEALEKLKADYVISPRDGEIYQTLTDAGCQEIATTDSYVFYRVD